MFKFLFYVMRFAGVFGLHLDTGGGGGGNAPTTTTTNTSNVPEYARPYMERLMGKAEALTSTPYQTYPGQRTADATALQKQSYDTVGGMQTGPAAFGAGVSQYMSPYQQNVTDIQKREATRQSDIQGQGQQAKATQAGAFGGYREAIERSERERNLGQQLDDIQARGAQSAFDRATSQYNTGQQQTQDVARLLNSMGTQQQANAQQNLNQQYQDFLNQKQQPYKDLGFMKDILSGSGSSSAQTQYGVAPNNSAQTAGLITAGLGALGRKDGGTIQGYAEGGVAGAPNDIELQSMLTKMSDAQLQQLAKSGKYDPQVIQQELQRRAQIRAGGLAALPAAQEEYADGGIIGFADKGSVPEPDGPAESTIGKWLRTREKEYGDLVEGSRNMEARSKALRKLDIAPWEAVTPKERARRTAEFERISGLPYGMDMQGPYADEATRGDKPRRPVDAGNATPPVQAGIGAPLAPAQTAVPSIGATDAKPTAKAKASGTGIASILKTKESATPPIAPPTAGTGFVADDYESIVRRRNELAKEGNAEIDSAYKEQQDRLKAERDEIKGRDKSNFWDAVMRGGLEIAKAGGQGKSTLTAAVEGLGAGLGSLQDAKKLDAAALKANQQAEDTLRQAKRAERSGNMDRTTALYAQYRNEITTAAQLEMQAAKLKQDYELALKQIDAQREGHRTSSANAGRNPQLEIYRALGDGDVKKGYEVAMQGKKEPMSRAEAMRSWEIAQYGKLPPGVTDFESYYRMMSGTANQPSGAVAPAGVGWSAKIVK